jgi:hypothetical protein
LKQVNVDKIASLHQASNDSLQGSELRTSKCKTNSTRLEISLKTCRDNNLINNKTIMALTQANMDEVSSHNRTSEKLKICHNTDILNNKTLLDYESNSTLFEISLKTCRDNNLINNKTLLDYVNNSTLLEISLKTCKDKILDGNKTLKNLEEEMTTLNQTAQTLMENYISRNTNLTRTVENQDQQIVRLNENLRSNASAVKYLRNSYKEEESMKKDLQTNLENTTAQLVDYKKNSTQLKIVLRQSQDEMRIMNRNTVKLQKEKREVVNNLQVSSRNWQTCEEKRVAGDDNLDKCEREVNGLNSLNLSVHFTDEVLLHVGLFKRAAWSNPIVASILTIPTGCCIFLLLILIIGAIRRKCQNKSNQSSKGTTVATIRVSKDIEST